MKYLTTAEHTRCMMILMHNDTH